MKKFNVIWWSFNDKEPSAYDIMPHLIAVYKDEKNKPQTFEDIKTFILKEARYHWWSRCEYEIIIQSWPVGDYDKKIDVYYQVELNIDLITEVFIGNITELKLLKKK